jgi:DNA-binding Lrp family transcriptional regulator
MQMQTEVQTVLAPLKRELPKVIAFPEYDSRFLLLKYLFTNGPSYPAKIADELKMSRSWVARALKKLEEEGYVENTNDKRKCTFCNGQGYEQVEGAYKPCVFCKGTGILEYRSYPVIYSIPERLKPAVSKLIYATADIKEEIYRVLSDEG